MARFVSQPVGLSDPFDRGQSGNAMPAPMLVVKAPRVTSTNTQPAASAENAASAGLWPAVRPGVWVGAMGRWDGWERITWCPHQTL